MGHNGLLWRVVLTSTILIPLALFMYGLSAGYGWMLAAVAWLIVAAYLSSGTYDTPTPKRTRRIARGHRRRSNRIGRRPGRL